MPAPPSPPRPPQAPVEEDCTSAGCTIRLLPTTVPAGTYTGGFSRAVDFRFDTVRARRWPLISATLQVRLEGDFGLGQIGRDGEPPGAAWNATVVASGVADAGGDADANGAAERAEIVGACAGVVGQCDGQLAPCFSAPVDVSELAASGRLRVAYTTHAPFPTATWACRTVAEFLLTLRYAAPPPQPPPSRPLPVLHPPAQTPPGALSPSVSRPALPTAANGAEATSHPFRLVGGAAGAAVALTLIGVLVCVCHRHRQSSRRRSMLLLEARDSSRAAACEKRGAESHGTELSTIGARRSDPAYDATSHRSEQSHALALHVLALVDRLQAAYSAEEEAKAAADQPRAAKAAEAEASTSAVAHLLSGAASADGTDADHDTRLVSSVRQMVLGQPEEATLGLLYFMRVPPSFVFPSIEQGVTAIVGEFETAGNDIDRECLQYVLRDAAGSSPKRFSNSLYPRE